MRRYETLMLISTETTSDELAALEKKLEELLSATEGEIESFDKWGKYRLAYPVRKNEYGIYILSRYRVPAKNSFAFFKEYDKNMKIKFNEIVMRYVTIGIDDETPDEYIKPEPVEAHESGTLDDFLIKNKIDRFLSDQNKPSYDNAEGASDTGELSSAGSDGDEADGGGISDIHSVIENLDIGATGSSSDEGEESASESSAEESSGAASTEGEVAQGGLSDEIATEKTRMSNL